MKRFSFTSLTTAGYCRDDHVVSLLMTEDGRKLNWVKTGNGTDNWMWKPWFRTVSEQYISGIISYYL